MSGLLKQIYLSPSAPASAGDNFGCPAEYLWSPAAYNNAFEYAKKLQIKFSTVDLTMKTGLISWLHRLVGEGSGITLLCPYPEENFTEDSMTSTTAHQVQTSELSSKDKDLFLSLVANLL